jgi:DNA-binding transcriptional MerR regulator
MRHKICWFCFKQPQILRIDSFLCIRKNHLVGTSEHNEEKMFKTKRVEGGAAADDNVFSSTDVSRLSSVSLRQLQWWDEQKVVSPRHEGHRRLYALEEVVEVSVIAELRKKGFSLQKIRRVLRFLQREMAKRLEEMLNPESDSAPADRRQDDPHGAGSRAHRGSFERRQAGHVRGWRLRPGPPTDRDTKETAKERVHGSGGRAEESPSFLIPADPEF